MNYPRAASRNHHIRSGNRSTGTIFHFAFRPINKLPDTPAAIRQRNMW